MKTKWECGVRDQYERGRMITFPINSSGTDRGLIASRGALFGFPSGVATDFITTIITYLYLSNIAVWSGHVGGRLNNLGSNVRHTAWLRSEKKRHLLLGTVYTNDVRLWNIGLAAANRGKFPGGLTASTIF